MTPKAIAAFVVAAILLIVAMAAAYCTVTVNSGFGFISFLLAVNSLGFIVYAFDNMRD